MFLQMYGFGGCVNGSEHYRYFGSVGNVEETGVPLRDLGSSTFRVIAIDIRSVSENFLMRVSVSDEPLPRLTGIPPNALKMRFIGKKNHSCLIRNPACLPSDQ